MTSFPNRTLAASALKRAARAGEKIPDLAGWPRAFAAKIRFWSSSALFWPPKAALEESL